MFKKRENVEEIEEGNLLSPKFDNDGLIPVVTMCSKTNEILMHGYMNIEALKKTIETKEAHYFSRSRKTIWHKGQISGFTQKVTEIKIDDEVILTGFRVGVVFYGGYSQIAKVNGDFLIKKPKNLTNKQAMILGTAGFTSLMASFAIKAREEILLGEKVNNVLVTGATGGVGSVAVIVLNKMGYNVTAVTGKDSKADYLKSLGAKNVVNRSEFDKDPKLIDKGLWDGVVDTVGGKILANTIVQTKVN